MRLTRHVMTAALLWALAGSSAGTTELRVPDGTPIVLICVDTLRSDRLPAYGYDGVKTPAIDALRRDGILFERAFTHIPLTLPAHTSLFTGLLPPDHGVRDNIGYTVDAAIAPLLQQTLKNAGYATGAGVSAYVLRRSTGIGVGFDFYEDSIEVTDGPGIQAIQRPGAETLNAVRPWLRSVTGGPFYLFFHIFEPHTPYEPPAKHASRVSSPYDGEVAAADEVVCHLLDELRTLGVYEKALIVFLSDHGEGLGEHGEAEHGLFLYRSTLQVPLIVKLPRRQEAGRTVAHPVQLIDVVPTIVSALGMKPEERLQGTPLLAARRPEPRDNPIYAETFFPRLHFGWSDLASIIVDSHHFIDAPRAELYDLARDPGEANDLIRRKPDLATELRTALSAFDRKLVSPAEVDPETRRQLEALGYLGQASTRDGDVLPDPKDRVGVLAQIRNAYRLYNDGDLAAAVTAYEHIIENDPQIETAWQYLALAQIGLGRLDEAIATYQKAIELMPHSGRMSLRIGMLLHHMGRLDEAFVHANMAIPHDPAAAHVLLAQIALAKSDIVTAEMEALEAISGGDRRPDARLVLADVYIARGEPQKAIDMLLKTLEEGFDSESVHAKLAITYVWIGDFDRAEEVLKGFESTDDLAILLVFGKLAISRQQWSEAQGWFDRALVVDPTNPTIKLNLGIIAMAEARLDDAERLLKEAAAGSPGSFEVWNTLGAVYARQRNAEKAIAAWDRAHEVNPGSVEVLFNLGLAHAQAGRFTRAAEYMEACAESAHGQQKERALAMAERMRSRASQGR